MTIEQNWLDKFKTLLLSLIIFTLPINLFWKINLDHAYVHGFLVDYLIPKFYLIEIPLLIFIFLEIWTLRQKIFEEVKKIKWTEKELLIIGLTITFIVRQFLTANPSASLSYLIHLVETVAFISLLRFDSFFYKEKQQKIIFKTITVTIAFQSILAYLQFLLQRSLLPYQILGETNLLDWSNISRGAFFNQEKILAYASTAHPNILAGIISIFTILIFEKDKNKKLNSQKIILLINLLLITVITQSVSAFLTLIMYQIYKFSQKRMNKDAWILFFYYLFLILLPYLMTKMNFASLSADSINRRNYLNKAAFEIFKSKQLWGTGLNNFTVFLEEFNQSRELIRFIQPVHNLALLILSEGGLLLMTLLYLIRDQAKTVNFWQKTLILLAIASLDHYLLTQVAGLNLLALFYFLI